MDQLFGQPVGKRLVVSGRPKIDERQHGQSRSGAPGGGRVHRGDRRNVCTPRELKTNGVISPFAPVIRCETRPKPVRINTDDRIRLRIERGVSPTDLQCDQVFLDRILLSG